MAVLIVDCDELVIHLLPLEQLAARHHDVRVPLAAVRSVTVAHRPASELCGGCAAGTVIPRMIAYGVRRPEGERPHFAAVVRRRPVVELALDERAEFACLLVSVPHANEVAGAVRAAAGRVGACCT